MGIGTVTVHSPTIAGADAPSTAIVIGAGLGGLAAAMRLGAKGYAVTVIDRLDRVGGRGSSISQDGYRFDLGPTIVTVPEVYEKLWAACGRDFHDDVKLVSLDPYYDIRWPDGSHLTVNGDTAAMEVEIARLSPGDVAGYHKFLDDAQRRYAFAFKSLFNSPMHKLWDTVKDLPTFARLRADQSILGLARRRVRDERLQMALSFHPLFIGGDPMNVTSMYALVSYLEKEFGVHYAMGGIQAIADAMARVIEAQGGQILLGHHVDEILLDRGKARGVRMADGRVFSAPLVVSNADSGHTYTHLLRNHRVAGWARGGKGRYWSMSLFVWYFGTRGTADLWRDVGHHTIISGPRYEGLLRDIFIKGTLADDMSIYLHRPSITDPSVAPAGDDAFYALSPVPHLGHTDPVDWSTELRPYRAKMARVLEETLPGFEAHLASEVIFTPETFRDRYLSPFGAGFSLEPRILQSGWFRPHNLSAAAEGLYLVGAGTHPGAGVPTVITSAEVLSKLLPDAPNPLQRPIPKSHPQDTALAAE